MKIIVSRISDGTRGGAEVSAFDQAKILKALGHEVVFINNIPDLLVKARAKKIKTYRLLWPHRGGRLLKPFYFITTSLLNVFWLCVIIFKERPDIFNPHSRDDQTYLTLMKTFHRKPVVWKDPGDIIYLIKQNRGSRFANAMQYIYKKSILSSDHVYVLNAQSQEKLTEEVGLAKSRVSIIPSSILYSDYDLNTEPMIKNTENSLIFGYAGRIHKIKGLEYAIKAFKSLSMENAELWLYGDGQDRERLKKLSEGDKKIRFMEYTDNIPGFLNSIDIFVQPAINEGWGRNVKEAMYFKKPIIGSNSGGIAKQIDDMKTGILFKPKNSNDLANKMELLAKNESLRKKIATNAYKKSVKDGDFTDIVKNKILPIYEKAIEYKT